MGGPYPRSKKAPLTPLGRAIRRRRFDMDYTIQQIASGAGVALTTVKKIEAGLIKRPHWGTIVAIARALELTLDDLAYAERMERCRGEAGPC